MDEQKPTSTGALGRSGQMAAGHRRRHASAKPPPRNLPSVKRPPLCPRHGAFFFPFLASCSPPPLRPPAHRTTVSPPATRNRFRQDLFPAGVTRLETILFHLPPSVADLDSDARCGRMTQGHPHRPFPYFHFPTFYLPPFPPQPSAASTPQVTRHTSLAGFDAQNSSADARIAWRSAGDFLASVLSAMPIRGLRAKRFSCRA